MTAIDQPAPADKVLIRPYRASDRSAIRNICCDTADAGEPLENFFSDRELVGDLITRYFTDYCSEYSWVAELHGEVAGYLTAAPDTHAFRKCLRRNIAPLAFIRAIGRGLLFRHEIRSLAGALLRRRGRFIRPPFQVPEIYPAHLHINLLKPARGRHAGRELIAALIQKLRTDRIPGIHATVRADNTGSCTFFERLDFMPISEYDEILPARNGVQDVHITVYGRKVD